MARQSFSGSAFYPSLGDEVIAGTISFNSTSLCFFATTGKIEIPFLRLRIRMDEASGRIYFDDSGRSTGNVFTDEFEIFEHRAFTHVPELRHQVRQLTGVKNVWLRLSVATGVFLAVFLVVALLVFWGGGLTLRYLVNKVPTTHESEMGDKLVGEFKKRGLLADDPKTIEFLQAMGKKILPMEAKRKFKFEFHIIPVSEPNAFAVPGGKIFVTQGALQLLNREELAGVLSHEISHVVKRHALRQIISSLGTYAALRLLFQGDTAFQSAVGEASEMLFTSGFSQALENEADDGGWNYLVAANIDPRSLPNSLKKLESYHKEFVGRDSTPQIFNSHPLTSERLKRFDKKWRELKSTNGFIDVSKAFPEKAKQ